MRFGICSNMVAKGPDKTGIEIVERVVELGYDYIELPLAEIMFLSDSAFADLKSKITTAGITCQACNNFFPAHVRLIGPDVDETLIETYYKTALKRAGELGAKVVVFGSGGSRNVPVTFSCNEAFVQMKGLIEKIAVVAAEKNITIAIEPLRQPECNFITTFAQGVEIAEQVSHPNVKVLMDFFHMAWEMESPSILLEHRHWLAHVHFSNPNFPGPIGRILPVSMDEWPYQEFIDTLHAINYQGGVSLEATASDFDTQAAQALIFLREHF